MDVLCPKKLEHTHSLLKHHDFLPKSTVGKGVGRNHMVEKPDKQYVGLVIKVTVRAHILDRI